MGRSAFTQEEVSFLAVALTTRVQRLAAEGKGMNQTPNEALLDALNRIDEVARGHLITDSRRHFLRLVMGHLDKIWKLRPQSFEELMGSANDEALKQLMKDVTSCDAPPSA